MCENLYDCPKANSCHRFLADKSEDQVFIKFWNICKESNNYKWQWVINEELIIKEEDVT